MNPHKRLVIPDPEKQKINPETMKHILDRERVVTWGWEINKKRIAFRVYKPHQYTAKGLLEEEGVEFD